MGRLVLNNGWIPLSAVLCMSALLNACAVLGGEQALAPEGNIPHKHKTLTLNGSDMPDTGKGDESATAAGTPHSSPEGSAAVDPALDAHTPLQSQLQAPLQSQLQQECSQRLAMADRFVTTSGDGKPVPQIRVGATGYGAPPKKYFPDGQRRLLTIRASKIDAYRALAEVVGGLHVWGGSAIADMVIEQDRYRVFVDSYVRGARVTSVSPLEDGTYKTVVEMHVDQRFLSQVMAFVDPLLAQCLKGDEKDNFAFYGGSSMAPSFYYSE